MWLQVIRGAVQSIFSADVAVARRMLVPSGYAELSLMASSQASLTSMLVIRNEIVLVILICFHHVSQLGFDWSSVYTMCYVVLGLKQGRTVLRNLQRVEPLKGYRASLSFTTIPSHLFRSSCFECEALSAAERSSNPTLSGSTVY